MNSIVSFEKKPTGHTHVLIVEYQPMANGKTYSGLQEVQFAYFGALNALPETLLSLAREYFDNSRGKNEAWVQSAKLVKL